DLFVVVVGDVGVDFVVSCQLWSAFGHGTTAEPPTGADDEGREQITTGAGDGLDRDRALLDHASEDDVARAAAVESVDGFDEQAAGLGLESPCLLVVRVHVNKLPT